MTSPHRLLALLVWSAAAAAAAQTAEGQAAPAQSAGPLPAVADPLLAPVPAPPVTLASWGDARALLDEGSSALRLAASDVERAQGRWRQALSQLLPTAAASAGLGYDLLNPKGPVPTVGSIAGILNAADGPALTVPLGAVAVTVTQPVVDVSAWAGLGAANADSRSVRASAEDVRRRAIQGLARAMTTVVTGERIAAVGRVGLQQALERQTLTERLVELGVVTELDAVRVRQDVAVARGTLVSSDEQLRVARELLGDVVGRDGEVGVAPSFTLEDVVKESASGCSALPSAAERSDVVAAREAAEAAAIGRTEALTGYLPRLDLNTSSSAFTTDPGPVDWSSWTVTAVLSVPLWEGGLREGLAQERGALANRALEQATQTQRTATIEVTRARRAETAARAVVDSARDARDLAANLDQMTRRSFEMGRADSLDLVQAAVVLRQAELELALRESDWVQRRLEAFFTLARCPE